MSFIGTLSQTLTLRAAFASSTYLLSQIPGPGRSSDDDLLTPLFKGAHQGLRAFHRRSAALPANSGPASEDAFPEEFHLRSTLSRAAFAAAVLITPDENFIEDAKNANRGVFFEPMSILIWLLISV